MTIQQKFGENVRKIRLQRGISQEKLAELAGLHRTYISSIELGKRNVSLQNIQALAFYNSIINNLTNCFPNILLF
ncbi:MAG: helix-turn-helix domain-containing protein [Acidobacteriota bacterium]|jgi:transcriptional regulator with XRE-family HTH domain|nr:helix-turn-helix domain-containing protein [Acidobacteriota bacterium]